jgi:hypothetical protein
LLSGGCVQLRIDADVLEGGRGSHEISTAAVHFVNLERPSIDTETVTPHEDFSNANPTRRICVKKLLTNGGQPQNTDNPYCLKTHLRPDQINTTLMPVVIVRAGDSPATPPSSITVTCGPKNGASNCLAIICGNSREGNSFDDRPVQPLELQMANVEIMEISMARNTDEKSSTVHPVWLSVILSSSDVV